MAEYNTYPAVDEDLQFPPSIREALVASAEFIAAIPLPPVIDPVNESSYPNGTVFYYTTPQ